MEDQKMPEAFISKFKKFLNKRNIYILFGVAILLEVIWAGWTLFKPSSFPPPARESSQTTEAIMPTVVSLSASQTSLKVGEKVNVDINISSNKKTDGTDLIITYDPKLLSVVTEGVSKNPVTVGAIYKDYPLNSLDTKEGHVNISGISDVSGGVLANGLFGKVVFQAKAPGVASISLDFSPGQTVDSNVIESGTGKDLLEKVNNLQINILP